MRYLTEAQESHLRAPRYQLRVAVRNALLETLRQAMSLQRRSPCRPIGPRSELRRCVERMLDHVDRHREVQPTTERRSADRCSLKESLPNARCRRLMS